MPEWLSVALKEWSAVVQALRDGRQTLLLRKGGIHDSGGEFELEHTRFLLFPTYVHQSPDMIAPDQRHRLEPRSVEPSQITLDTAGQVVQVLPVSSRQKLQNLEAFHIWSGSFLDKRLAYKPERPLLLLVVRAFALARPVTIENSPAYAGCKSWVPLETPIDATGAPAIDDDTFQRAWAAIRARVAQ
ncbi:MAG: DUF1802 family protein [Phycisphaerae bacterium]|nr:DUF1802 family protein [Phycisphaerae bacterium]MDW8262043.1 DUF1802 family protein [Phycisphaerales bacterium]